MTVETIKRIGPGRPKKENSKSQAERAREYRLRQKVKKGLVGANTSNETNNHSKTIQITQTELNTLKQDLATMTDMLGILISAKQRQKSLPKDIFSNIIKNHLLVSTRHDFL